jgi:hypothetical protein
MAALHEALVRAIADCGEGVGKDKQAQGYKFRGIDQVLNFLNPILARYQLALVPHGISDELVVERQSKNGGVLYFARAKVEFRLYHSSGDSLPVVTWVEAMDSSDKALNKVMSIAWKYAAIQTFCIPVDDVADETTHRDDMAPSRQAPSTPPPKSEPMAPVEFLLGELQGTLVREASPETIKRYLVAVERHGKNHPELPRAEIDTWRAHYRTVKSILDAIPTDENPAWGMEPAK